MLSEWIKRKISPLRDTDMIPVLTHDGKKKYTKEIMAFAKLKSFVSAGYVYINSINGDPITEDLYRDGEVTGMIYDALWNMDASPDVNYQHGLSDAEAFSIREINVMIADRNGTTYRPLNCMSASDGAVEGGVSRITNDRIYLTRRTNGQFDGFAHNSAKVYITFKYIPDTL